MKAPSSTLVLDAAVLVAAARGRSSGAVLEAARAAVLVTTDRVLHEACRRIELGLKRPDLLAIVDALAAEMTVVPRHDARKQCARVRSRCEKQARVHQEHHGRSSADHDCSQSPPTKTTKCKPLLEKIWE